MAKQTNEPFLWALFSAGGTVAAFLIPIHILLFGLAFPLRWLEAPSYGAALELLKLPLTRLYLFVFCFLSLFHWAHRFRHTIQDALPLRDFGNLIAGFSYGVAAGGTVLAGYMLWKIP